MSDLATPGSADAAINGAIEDKTWVIRRASELLAEGDPQYAREIVRAALDAFGRQPDLLWMLAEAEFAGGDLIAGRKCLDDALTAGPLDPASVARQIRILRGNGFWREALSTVQALCPEERTDPLVRAEAGNLYRACECPAHAVDNYGPRRGLPRSSRVARRWCWLLSGGPSERLRRKARAWEDVSLHELRYPSGYIASVSAMKGLDERQVRRVQGQLETLRYRYQRRWYGWLAVHRAGYRLIPLAAIPVWLVLLIVVSLAGFTPGPARVPGFAAVSATVATIPVIAATKAMLKPNGLYRFQAWPAGTIITFLFIVIAAEAAAAEGYARDFLPTAGLPAAAVLGLVAAPAALACLPIAYAVVGIPKIVWSRRIIRQNSLIVAIDWLLIVLHDLRSPQVYRGMAERLYHCSLLELTARCLTKSLLPQSEISHLGSSDWLARRGAGWGEAIRHTQRQIIAPVPGSQSKVEAFLVHEIRSLVTGDIGALSWRQPPLPPPRPTTLRRQAISGVRAILVAALPLAVVLAAQPFLHASASLFDWARIATAVWALLYVLLSIDPAMREKISAARDLADLMQTAPGLASRNIQQ